jgi:hypothetical protein
MGTLLSLPEEGFRRSVTANNVNRSIMGDWLEASALFAGEAFSTNEVVDILVEQGVVDLELDSDAENEQGLAYGIAEEGWTELRNRLAASGPSPCYEIAEKFVKPTAHWSADPVRSFLITLSLAPMYPKWAEACRAIGEQGLLFEKVSARACAEIFSGWVIYEAGWSPTGQRTVGQIVQDMISDLGVRGNANLGEWAPRAAKDGGLDLICFRQFPDQRECVPLFAIQCASGADWIKKLHQPSTNKWKTFLDSAFEPTRALTIPFVVDRNQMLRHSLDICGPLFDRNRLLSAGQGLADWMNDIRQELIDWCQPRIELLHAA